MGGSRGACPQRLCIIALTADLDVGVKRACFEGGMDGAVRKPIVAHELLAALIHAGFVAVEAEDAVWDVLRLMDYLTAAHTDTMAEQISPLPRFLASVSSPSSPRVRGGRGREGMRVRGVPRAAFHPPPVVPPPRMLSPRPRLPRTPSLPSPQPIDTWSGPTAHPFTLSSTPPPIHTPIRRLPSPQPIAAWRAHRPPIHPLIYPSSHPHTHPPSPVPPAHSCMEGVTGPPPTHSPSHLPLLPSTHPSAAHRPPIHPLIYPSSHPHTHPPSPVPPAHSCMEVVTGPSAHPFTLSSTPPPIHTPIRRLPSPQPIAAWRAHRPPIHPLIYPSSHPHTHPPSPVPPAHSCMEGVTGPSAHPFTLSSTPPPIHTPIRRLPSPQPIAAWRAHRPPIHPLIYPSSHPHTHPPSPVPPAHSCMEGVTGPSAHPFTLSSTPPPIHTPIRRLPSPQPIAAWRVPTAHPFTLSSTPPPIHTPIRRLPSPQPIAAWRAHRPPIHPLIYPSSHPHTHPPSPVPPAHSCMEGVTGPSAHPFTLSSTPPPIHTPIRRLPSPQPIAAWRAHRPPIHPLIYPSSHPHTHPPSPVPPAHSCMEGVTGPSAHPFTLSSTSPPIHTPIRRLPSPQPIAAWRAHRPPIHPLIYLSSHPHTRPPSPVPPAHSCMEVVTGPSAHPFTLSSTPPPIHTPIRRLPSPQPIAAWRAHRPPIHPLIYPSSHPHTHPPSPVPPAHSCMEGVTGPPPTHSPSHLPLLPSTHPSAAHRPPIHPLIYPSSHPHTHPPSPVPPAHSCMEGVTGPPPTHSPSHLPLLPSTHPSAAHRPPIHPLIYPSSHPHTHPPSPVPPAHSCMEGVTGPSAHPFTLSSTPPPIHTPIRRLPSPQPIAAWRAHRPPIHPLIYPSSHPHTHPPSPVPPAHSCMEGVTGPPPTHSPSHLPLLPSTHPPTAHPFTLSSTPPPIHTPIRRLPSPQPIAAWRAHRPPIHPLIYPSSHPHTHPPSPVPPAHSCMEGVTGPTAHPFTLSSTPPPIHTPIRRLPSPQPIAAWRAHRPPIHPLIYPSSHPHTHPPSPVPPAHSCMEGVTGPPPTHSPSHLPLLPSTHPSAAHRPPIHPLIYLSSHPHTRPPSPVPPAHSCMEVVTGPSAHPFTLSSTPPPIHTPIRRLPSPQPIAAWRAHRPPIHPLIYLSSHPHTRPPSPVPPAHSCMEVVTGPSAHPFTLSSTPPPIHTPIRRLPSPQPIAAWRAPPPTHPPIHPPIHPRIHPSTHASTHPPTHPPIYSFILPHSCQPARVALAETEAELQLLHGLHLQRPSWEAEPQPLDGSVRVSPLRGLHLQWPSWEAELQPLEGVKGVVEVVALNGLHLQRPSWEAELQPLEGVTGVVEVVVFDMRVRHMIGYRWRNSSSTDTTPFAHTDSGVEGNEEGSGPLFFCCTKELEPLTGCTVGRLIVRRAAHEPDRLSWAQLGSVGLTCSATAHSQSLCTQTRTCICYHVRPLSLPYPIASQWPCVLEYQFLGNSSLTAPLLSLLSPLAALSLLPAPVASRPGSQWPRVLEAQFLGNSSLTAPLDADLHIPRPGFVYVLEAQFIGNSSLTATLDAEVHVPRAGFVYVWLAMCDKNLDNTKVFGHTEWRAHGWGECLSFVVNSPSLPHLPHAPLSSHSFASFNTLPLFHPLTPLLCRPSLPPSFPMPPPLQLYTLLYLAWRPQFGPAWHSLDRNSLPHFLTFLVSPFHSPLPSLPPSQLYTFLYLAWRPQFGPAWHSLDRNSLPHFLTFLLLLSLLSTLTTLCDLLLLCTTGHRFVLVTLAAVTALIPAALYVLVAATCEAVRTVGQVDDWGSGEHVALRSPLVLLDLCLAAWLIPAALTTKAQCMQASDSRLLSTFRQALSAMGGISAAALALTCWEAYVKLSDPLNLQWQSDWLITAAWHLLSFLALASLCFLWSPALLSLRHDGSTQGDKGGAASLLS
ncbi:unnamed protein product [Closterium sp. Naga37s-1]|nr:unnamed protein product [Closterium sp. Naga37s-1]